jgi:two-component system LytT family response regulator
VIGILIVDDEMPARARLRQLLSAHRDVEILGEAETGTEAMRLACELKPSAVLLDIQMPGCTGMDVAASLPEPRPHLVFCTAFDQHAVDAFELDAVDYLLKPISRARLAIALDRLRSAMKGNRESDRKSAVNRITRRHLRGLLPVRRRIDTADRPKFGVLDGSHAE